MTPYRARRYQHQPDEPTPEPAHPLAALEKIAAENADPPDLRTHKGLDTVAHNRGHTWTKPNLSAQQKRRELALL